MQSYNEGSARQAFPAGTLGNHGRKPPRCSLASWKARMAASTLSFKPLPIMAEPEDVYFPTGGSGSRHADGRRGQAGSRVALHGCSPTGPEGAKIIVENTGFAPTNALVIEDETYLADFYAENPMHPARRMNRWHVSPAPGTPFPGAEGRGRDRPHRSRPNGRSQRWWRRS